MPATLVSKEDIEALLRATPETPENELLLSQLIELRRNSLLERRPYSANVAFAAIAPAASSAGTINIDANAPFVITNQNFVANVTIGLAQTVSTFCYPNFSVLLTLTGSQRPLMDVATPVVSIFGNGQQPYYLPEPTVIPANSVLQVNVTSFENANSPLIRLTFNGYRLYALG